MSSQSRPSVEEVCSKVAELLDVKPERCRFDSSLVDLVSDSFRLVEMAIEIQEDYGVMFGQEDLRRLTTVGDLAELVRSR